MLKKHTKRLTMTTSIGIPYINTESSEHVGDLKFQDYTASIADRFGDGENHIAIGFNGVNKEFGPNEYIYSFANLHAHAFDGDIENKAVTFNNSTIELIFSEPRVGLAGASITAQSTDYGAKSRVFLNSEAIISGASQVLIYAQTKVHNNTRKRPLRGIDSIALDNSKITFGEERNSVQVLNLAKDMMPSENATIIASYVMKNSFIDLGNGNDELLIDWGSRSSSYDPDHPDVSTVLKGKNTIDGGSGCDLVSLPFEEGEAEISNTAGGHLVTEKATGGKLYLKNVETIKFKGDKVHDENCSSRMTGEGGITLSQEEALEALKELGIDLDSLDESQIEDLIKEALETSPKNQNESTGPMPVQGGTKDDAENDECGLNEFISLVKSTRLAAYNFPADMARDRTFETLRASAFDFVDCSNESIANDKPIKVNNQYTITLGTTGNDRIKGARKDDIIYSTLGKDKIKGKNGDDIIFASKGDDIMDGGKGDDILYGEVGADTYKISKGDDVFMYFDPYTDKLKGKLDGATLEVVNDGIMLQHGRGNILFAGINDAEKLTAVESLL